MFSTVQVHRFYTSTVGEVIKWKRNIFVVPFGDDGGHIVAELARLIGLFYLFCILFCRCMRVFTSSASLVPHFFCSFGLCKD